MSYKKQAFKSDEEQEPEEAKTYIPKASECFSNFTLWEKWLTMTYQSYTFEDGKKYKAAILDVCPACDSTGTVGVKVKRHIYNRLTEYEEALACPVCLTGQNKHQRLSLPISPEKPTCLYAPQCCFKDILQKQPKCHKMICKFDSTNNQKGKVSS